VLCLLYSFKGGWRKAGAAIPGARGGLRTGKGRDLSRAKLDVAIVGGGFSGALLAVGLLRCAPDPSLAVVDKGPLPGRGLAYGTQNPRLLLNVPAGNMSALAEDPDHFLRWAQANYGEPVQASTFLPRPFYGRYLGSVLEKALGDGTPRKLRWIQGEVSSVTHERSSLEVRLTDGGTLRARSVVIAAGNFPPANLNIPGLSADSKRYFRSPWSAAALRDIPKHHDVLLIGSGLTSIDLAVALESEGFAGHIHFLSRHGLMPQIHRLAGQWPQFWNERGSRTMRGLLRLVREQVRAGSEAGRDWREVIDSLRPVTQNIWQSLSAPERRRFLRHVRSYWEVHRHRIAPEIGDAVAKLVRQGQATVHAGRVTNYREFPDRVEVRLCDRKTRGQRALQVDRVINCTGPETDYRRIDHPLIRNLLAQGLARPDPLFLGLDVDSTGALIDSSGLASGSLYVIGPARKGSLWETIAVPEIRSQASALARHLALALEPNPQTDPAVFAITGDVNDEQPTP
jgi:uncharacterized NAD(P)/FAD-binding protein YdhS